MSLFALAHPCFAAAFLYAAYADGAAYAAGCLRLPDSIVSWHCELKRPTPPKKKTKKKGGGPAWAYCPARPPELILFFTTPLFSHSSTWTFVFHSPVSPTFSFFISLGLYVLACPQGHLHSYFDSYTLSLSLNSLVEIFMFTLRTLFSPPSSLITTNF